MPVAASKIIRFLMLATNECGSILSNDSEKKIVLEYIIPFGTYVF